MLNACEIGTLNFLQGGHCFLITQEARSWSRNRRVLQHFKLYSRAHNSR